ncbi:hypothetical protein M407DRAFT_16961 [Tulasnella calospora MUT 4182]|uniref:Aminotransferase class I/classII large domain-containing protein n=1 Tax=Tulasnella calospora MUT 4182 TaxID=1051891 RepID=A0A0C3QMX8_9AGAM|nr:hypothetical protein M407DRAFT_16961 [Tulasnella calospora MUT 4182]
MSSNISAPKLAIPASLDRDEQIVEAVSASPMRKEYRTQKPNDNILPSAYYDRYLSATAKQCLPSPFPKALSLSRTPGMLSMSSGLPAPETFPFRGLSVTVSRPDTANRHESSQLEFGGDLLEEALQGSNTGGLPKFVDWLYGLQERYHRRRHDAEEEWSLSVGCGVQDLLSKAFTCLLNEGDSVLVEVPVYPGVIPNFRLLQCHIAEVTTDAEGVVIEDLERVLRTWPKHISMPKFLYTVPYGCNPTGASATLERRLRVLELAREFNFLILEDDPYFYLYYGGSPRPPSYFQLEKETPGSVGHVMRFDSFSKILSSGEYESHFNPPPTRDALIAVLGLRLGFVSGPTPIVAAMNRITSSSTVQPPGLTQAVTYALLNHWGYDGFQQHVDHIASVYSRKRDLFISAMQRHLTGLAEWSIPEAGMFVWFKLLLPPARGSDEGDSEDLIVRRALKENVLALPGTSFFTNGRASAYVRASFSVLPEEHFDEAMRRLAAVVREVRLEGGKSIGYGSTRRVTSRNEPGQHLRLTHHSLFGLFSLIICFPLAYIMTSHYNLVSPLG